MTIKSIPDGFHTVTPYMMIEDAAVLIDFLNKAFDAEEISRSAMPDGTIVNAELRIGDSMIMLADCPNNHDPMPCMIYLYVENTDETYEKALEAGGESLMKPADQFYGDRNAGIKDPSGNKWWIATHIEDVTPEEM